MNGKEEDDIAEFMEKVKSKYKRKKSKVEIMDVEDYNPDIQQKTVQ